MNWSRSGHQDIAELGKENNGGNMEKTLLLDPGDVLEVARYVSLNLD